MDSPQAKGMDVGAFLAALATIGGGGTPVFTGQLLSHAQIEEVRDVLNARKAQMDEYFNNTILCRGYGAKLPKQPAPPVEPSVVINHILTRINTPEATGAYVTATHGTNLIGGLHLRLIEDMGFVSGFYVDECFRSSGVGRSMLNVAENLAREDNRHGVWLTVNIDNEAAQRFYERNGYRRGAKFGAASWRYYKHF